MELILDLDLLFIPGIQQEDVEQLQLNLIRSHATGLGPNLAKEFVRSMMCVRRINSLIKGHSGCHPDVVKQLVEFLNNSIHPIVPRIGSLGASGDLAPLSHLACALIGEGDVEFNGNVINAMDAIQQCELVPLKLRAKDGLSLINGTSLITGMLSLAVEKLRNLLTYGDVIAGMSIDATESTLTPFDARIHRARPHRSNICCRKVSINTFRFNKFLETTMTAIEYKILIHSDVYHKSMGQFKKVF